MAEEQVEVEVAPKSKKKTLIIIIAAVLVLAIAAGAAFLLLGGKKKDKGEEEHHAEKDVKTATVAFEEKFTVNLSSDDGVTHFLQVPKIELEVTNADVAKQVEEKKGKIMDRISSTLRRNNMKDLLQPGGDVKLKEDIKTEINKVLDKNKGVEEVILPASFIVQ